MATNLGVTIEVYQELSPSQKSIVRNNNKDMAYFPVGNPRTHAMNLGWKKYRTITIKGDKGHILIKK